MENKIFVRERRKVDKGEKKPRFRIVGVSGSGVKVYVKHARKKELEQISSETGAKIVYLDAGQEKATAEKNSSGSVSISAALSPLVRRSFQRFALECIPGRFASAFCAGMVEKKDHARQIISVVFVSNRAP